MARRKEGARAPNLRSSIYLGSDGIWHGWVTMGVRSDGSPDRRHRQGRTETEVTRKVRALEAKRDAGRPGKPGRVPTLQEWMTYWLTTVLPLAGKAPRTIDDYWSKCRSWIFPSIGGHRLDRCHPEHLEALYGKMTAAGIAPSHVRKVHAIIFSAYGAAVKREKVGRNPAALVDPPSIGEAEKDSLRDDEARAVLSEAARRRNSARWSIGLSCGLRQGEALGLRWAYLVGRCRECDYPARLDVCWSEPGATRCPRCGAECRAEALIWYQLQRLPWRHGCDDPSACTKDRHRWPCPKDCPKASRPSGRRHRCIPADDPHLCPKDCQRHAKACPNRQGGGLVLRPIKERRKKTVPLAPELVTILRAHHEEQQREREAAGDDWHDHDLVFCEPAGAPIDPRRDWGEWADILKAAGLPHHGVHAARHTAATLLMEQGVALAVVQEMLGHSDIRVTRGYTHVASPLTQDAANRMGKALFGTATKTATKNEEPEPSG